MVLVLGGSLTCTEEAGAGRAHWETKKFLIPCNYSQVNAIFVSSCDDAKIVFADKTKTALIREEFLLSRETFLKSVTFQLVRRTIFASPHIASRFNNSIPFPGWLTVACLGALRPAPSASSLAEAWPSSASSEQPAGLKSGS